MLSKKKRLNRDMFNRFFAHGKRLHSESFDVVFTPNPTFHGAVVISKKVASRAVVRNTIRRRVYSLLQEQVQSGVWLIFLRKTKEIPSRATLKQELTQIQKKLIRD